MTISVTLTVDKPIPTHGDTVTATYHVTGNDGTPEVPAASGQLVGHVNIGGQDFEADVTLTKPGVAAVAPLPESYSAPTFAGLSFVGTPDPHVFTALVP